MRAVLAGLVALAVLDAGGAQAQFWPWRPTSTYALDGLPRYGTLTCDRDGMTRYRPARGALRYSSAVVVHPAFAARLPDFERVVSEVAREVYGRAPTRALTSGGYVCRPVRGGSSRISEHALGNALDVRGFDVPALGRRAQMPPGLPRALRRAFNVSLERHWTATSETGAVHSRFLRLLISRLVNEDVFRVIYGPAHPGHRDHFHFDMSPFRWIHV